MTSASPIGITPTPALVPRYFHLDIPISSGVGYMNIPGALYFEVALRSQAYLNGSDARVLASDPSYFTAITLPDVGNVTPESLGITVTTDSGTASPNVAAVPEPSSSLVLAGVGVAGMLGYGWHRRRTST